VLQEKFSVAGDAKSLVRALGKKKTLREIAHSTLHFEAEPTGEESPPSSVEVSPNSNDVLATPSPATEATPTAVNRSEKPSPSFIFEERDAPLSNPLPLSIAGLFLVTEDENGVAELLLQRLKETGADGVLVTRTTLSSEVSLIQAINDARESHGPVRGIVHLAPLSSEPLPADWEAEIHHNIQSLFTLLRHCSSDLQQAGGSTLGRILTTSLLGGSFGRDPNKPLGNLSGAAGVGVIKTLDLEWPNVVAKSVDFETDLAPAAIADHCLDELLYSTNQTEVGYRDGDRLIFVPTAQTPSESPEYQFGADEVIVATGGARGITAKCLQAMTAAGARLVILGRSARAPERIAPFANCSGLPGIRKRLLEDPSLRPADAAPAEIETLANRILHLLEIEKNLAQLQHSGVRVDYRSVDITDAEKLRHELRSIRSKYKTIHHFLHGAGVLADNLIEKKSDTDILRVIGTKIRCLPVLAEELTELKSLTLFASVSGRFGNYGQSDYAAANEVLNRFALHFRNHSPSTRVISINWGPWADGGMADPGVLRKLRERGIEPIPPEEGIAFLKGQLGNPAPSTEVVAGAGPWAEDDLNLAGAFDAGLFLLSSNASFTV
ncbi:MAG: SDR family NAD(P)-dependent oxidoreductase, partial [Puniceicoccales bacterium]